MKKNLAFKFKFADVNGNGKLSRAEFGSFRAPHSPEREAKWARALGVKRLAEHDHDKDGKVTMEEYVASFPGHSHPDMEREVFKQIDVDGDGFATADEFSGHGKGVNQRHEEGGDADIVFRLDKNEDGKLSHEELLADPHVRHMLQNTHTEL